MEIVRQPGIGEGYIMQPFAGGKIYSQEFIDAFNKFYGYDKGLGSPESNWRYSGHPEDYQSRS